MRSADRTAKIETFASLDALPSEAAGVLAAAEDFFATRAWWDAVLSHGIPPGHRPELLLIRIDGKPTALFPMLLDPGGGGFRALTTPYTGRYEPLIATDRRIAFTALARHCRAKVIPVTRIDALDPATASEFAEGGRSAGLVPVQFDHFGNWQEDVAGLDWPAWLARRPGAPRETIRRRMRRAERLDGARFELFAAQNDMASGIAAFETVYARSWKEPEPFADFNPAQIRAAASLGLARLGVWWVGDTPAAAQFWILERGRATVLKLAHDEAFKAHSAGTVLTAWMIRHMITVEHVAALDFGRGDDAYKQDWVSDRRQRVGLLLVNPRHPSGLLTLARHAMGRMKARLRHG